jgi:hypothetical protein
MVGWSDIPQLEKSGMAGILLRSLWIMACGKAARSQSMM